MNKKNAQQAVEKISKMDRKNLVCLLRQLDCDFKLDFTEAFFRRVSLERLRHIALAAVLRSHNNTLPRPAAG